MKSWPLEFTSESGCRTTDSSCSPGNCHCPRAAPPPPRRGCWHSPWLRTSGHLTNASSWGVVQWEERYSPILAHLKRQFETLDLSYPIILQVQCWDIDSLKILPSDTAAEWQRGEIWPETLPLWFKLNCELRSESDSVYILGLTALREHAVGQGN